MITTRSISVIEVGDWDDLVEKTYNRPYRLQQQNGCRDRQMFSISVPSTEDYYDDKGLSLNDWLDEVETMDNVDYHVHWEARIIVDRETYPKVHDIINDLFKKGLLEKGEYGIKIDW